MDGDSDFIVLFLEPLHHCRSSAECIFFYDTVLFQVYLFPSSDLVVMTRPT